MRTASLILLSCLVLSHEEILGPCSLVEASDPFIPECCVHSSCMFKASRAQQRAEGPLIPDEPEEYDPREIKAFYDWRNDLFFREFDMSGVGRTDFMTARRTYRVWLSEFGDPIALTMANPLFYWVDLNRNGKFESDVGEMWSDPEEDGINGNERPYDVSDLQSSGPPVSQP